MEETQQPDTESATGRVGGGTESPKVASARADSSRGPGWWHGLDPKYRVAIIVALIGLCGTLATPFVEKLADIPWRPTPTPTPIPTPRLVALKTYHNRYVTATDEIEATGEVTDWKLKAETTEIREWEVFTLFCLNNGKIALKTYHNRYVTAMGGDGDWILRAETSDRLSYEEFTVVQPDTWEQLPCQEVEQLPCPEMFKRLETGEVKIALKTHHSRYVTAMGEDGDWIIVAEREESEGVHLFEGFTVIPQ